MQQNLEYVIESPGFLLLNTQGLPAVMSTKLYFDLRMIAHYCRYDRADSIVGGAVHESGVLPDVLYKHNHVFPRPSAYATVMHFTMQVH